MSTTPIPSHPPQDVALKKGSGWVTSQVLLSQRESGVQRGPPPCYLASTTEPTQPQRTVSQSVYHSPQGINNKQCRSARLLIKPEQTWRGIPPSLAFSLLFRIWLIKLLHSYDQTLLLTALLQSPNKVNYSIYVLTYGSGFKENVLIAMFLKYKAFISFCHYTRC